MNSSVKWLISTIALLAAIAGCGDVGSDLDFSVAFNGSLSERQSTVNVTQQAKAPVLGRVCVFGECGETDASGDFNFKAYENFRGGNALVSVQIGAVDTQVTVELPENADEVRMTLSVDQNYRNLTVDSLEVVKTK